MDSRRLIVWISAGILGFQGATLALDLLNCTVLAWIVVQHRGVNSTTTDPLAVFCARPQHRIDTAVSQGLSVLAGLALGSSVVGPGNGRGGV
jgi:hypothetical protein